jgi:hypothetical protein
MPGPGEGDNGEGGPPVRPETGMSLQLRAATATTLLRPRPAKTQGSWIACISVAA